MKEQNRKNTEQMRNLKKALAKEPVPEGLSPEAICKKLEALSASEKDTEWEAPADVKQTIEELQDDVGAKRRGIRYRYRKWALLAASLLICVVIGGTIMAVRQKPVPEQEAQDTESFGLVAGWANNSIGDLQATSSPKKMMADAPSQELLTLTNSKTPQEVKKASDYTEIHQILVSQHKHQEEMARNYNGSQIYYTDTIEKFAMAEGTVEQENQETVSEDNAVGGSLSVGGSTSSVGGGTSSVGGSSTVSQDVSNTAAGDMAGSGSTTADSADTASGNADKEHSETNVQTEGVDEGDVIKTDGKFLYVLGTGRQTLRVVRINGGEMSLCDEKTFSSDAENTSVHLEELYIDNGILTAFVETEERHFYYKNGDNYLELDTEASTQDYYTDVYTKEYVTVYTYRVEEDGTLTEIGSRTQDGAYKSSRKAGDMICLFTSYYPFPQHEAEAVPMEFVPQVNGVLLEQADIAMQDTQDYECIEEEQSWYIVGSSFTQEDPGNTVDQMAVFTHDYSDQMYASKNAVYFASSRSVNVHETPRDASVGETASESVQEDGISVDYENKTVLIKYGYENGIFTAQGTRELSGLLNDTFSLYEYDGWLYVLTTQNDSASDWESSNHLFVLDASMNAAGCINNIARGETIRSARVRGTIGYFVTYEQTDPLFTVDLSDPYAPVIVGELKIPGFSSYLHFYSDSLLLGLGEETTESGEWQGYKLAMYDISDPANVLEADKLLLNDIPEAEDVTYCSAVNGYNYKELLIDPKKNLIGFYGESDGLTAGYFLFSYENGEFVTKLYHPMEGDISSVRGLYVGDTLYLCIWKLDSMELAAFDMTNAYAEIGSLELQGDPQEAYMEQCYID